MNILLLGKNSSITDTVKEMLQSIDGWSVSFNVELSPFPPSLSSEPSEYDVLVANLEDFNTSPIPFIKEINNRYPKTPLLIIHSYNNKKLIIPMLTAGAMGYIQNEMSEDDLFKAVRNTSKNQEILIADYT